ncbi:MAG: hypothetical protein ICV85_00745 [Tolypothrix sp. T3-bin4]|nr:hypothetical protein [Tolypothrix sp. Co-bin9]MBD0300736.1 hypothetical protein [Tolypothrix sp. T3-bin4]
MPTSSTSGCAASYQGSFSSTAPHTTLMPSLPIIRPGVETSKLSDRHISDMINVFFFADIYPPRK